MEYDFGGRDQEVDEKMLKCLNKNFEDANILKFSGHFETCSQNRICNFWFITYYLLTKELLINLK